MTHQTEMIIKGDKMKNIKNMSSKDILRFLVSKNFDKATKEHLKSWWFQKFFEESAEQFEASIIRED